MNSLFNQSKFILVLVLAFSIVVSCDNSTGDDHEHEEEPVALRVKQNGAVVAERTENGTTTGTIQIIVGNATAFTVLFVSEDGDEFTPHVDEHSITVTASSSAFTVSSVNSDSEPFGFTLTGASAGEETVSITMNHEGAPEFGPIVLPVVISAGN